MSSAAQVIKSVIESLPLSEQAEWTQAFNQHLLSGGAKSRDFCEGLEVGQVVRGVTVCIYPYIYPYSVTSPFPSPSPSP